MAEWENVPLDPKKKKKQRVNLEPRRPMAAQLTMSRNKLLVVVVVVVVVVVIRLSLFSSFSCIDVIKLL